MGQHRAYSLPRAFLRRSALRWPCVSGVSCGAVSGVTGTLVANGRVGGRLDSLRGVVGRWWGEGGGARVMWCEL
jgi:hypothetical protein